MIHRRLKNLKKGAELCIAKAIYTQIQHIAPVHVAYENLRGLRTRGKRGTLVKVVNYMYKRSDGLANRLQEWNRFSVHIPQLNAVDPWNTSNPFSMWRNDTTNSWFMG